MLREVRKEQRRSGKAERLYLAFQCLPKGSDENNWFLQIIEERPGGTSRDDE